MTDYSIFASALPGFENVTQSELARLGIPMAESTAGGVTFRGGLREMLIATVWSRTISHVLCRIGNFQATKLPELRRKATELPWCDFISPQSAVNVRATCHRSRLYHSDAVAQRVEQAITDAIPGVVASADDDCFQVAVRMQHDQCTVSIDVANTPLHRRGYRLRTAKAPLAEHIAAATLLWLGWKTEEPLADPMCGSGTFGIEAACLAGVIPSVTHAQRLSARRWPIWRQGILDEVLASRTQTVSKCDIHLSDHTRGAVDATRENAARWRKRGAAYRVSPAAKPRVAVAIWIACVQPAIWATHRECAPTRGTLRGSGTAHVDNSQRLASRNGDRQS